MKHLYLIGLFVLIILIAGCQSLPPTVTAVPTEQVATPTSIAATPTALPTPTAQPIPVNLVTLAPAASPTVVPTSPLPTVPPTPCAPPPGWPAYIVQPGDTLFQIALNTGISVDQLKSANCLVGDTIYAGRPLFVPFIPYIPPAILILPPQPPGNAPTGSGVIVESPIPPSPGDPIVAVQPQTGTPGTRFTFQIEHFKPNEPITIRVVSDATFEVLFNISAAVDARGSGMFYYYSPGTAAPGSYTVDISGTSSAASGAFTLTPSP